MARILLSRRRLLPLIFAALLSLASPPVSFAQGGAPDLSQMSIEDLMRIEITSVARREQRAADVAAAVFVITADDIRRSGLTTIPELLRLAPGVDVAQINSSKWAVTVRGFNDLSANKLLVLVDGRSVYNLLFSGVLWDEPDVMLDDIDRIEVIRGPGAATWGANAVNGVINIVTKSSADTTGVLVRVRGGNADQQAAVRYGGIAGASRYRVHAQWTDRAASLLGSGTDANDASQAITTGFRFDRVTRPGELMLEGALTAGRTRALWQNFDPQTATLEPFSRDPSEAVGGHLLGRLTHTRANGGALQIQGFLDLANRDEPLADFSRRAFDLDTQYHATVGGRHDLVAGLGFRAVREHLAGHVGTTLDPAATTASLLTGFVQDEIALFENRLAITLGSQVQYDSESGAGVQPTARAIWKGLPRQRLWAAVSRALKTPALVDRGIRIDFPPQPDPSGLPVFVTTFGNPQAETEELVSVEGGYRIEVGTRGSIDATAFAGHYDHLVTQEPGAPIVALVPSPRVLVTTHAGNLLMATTRGFEIAASWAPTDFWRVDGNYSAFDIVPTRAAGSLDVAAATFDASAPRHKWHLRSSLSRGAHATVNLSVFRVGSLEELRVPAWTRVDLNAEWRFTSRLSAMVVGQNLLDEAHTEFSGARALLAETQVRRGAAVRLRWTFQ